ncbi:S-adenosyl-L-methionine-dependent methyltransferases superfamily protein [Tasmannia lanceolata]|uniref:S-adenosyl-L-methionine-dependent methyltransferases superfamily protein n=1 Tax=Tasmannia lanceolata TaxID=3420 RepID=UPI004062D950
MPVFRFGRQAKRPYGFCSKVTVAVFLGLCFIVIWSMFSSPSSSLSSQRDSFSDISVVPISVEKKGQDSVVNLKNTANRNNVTRDEKKKDGGKEISDGESPKKKDGDEIVSFKDKNDAKTDDKKEGNKVVLDGEDKPDGLGVNEDEIEKEGEEDDLDKGVEEEMEGDRNSDDSVERESVDENGNLKGRENKKKSLGPLFDSRTHYTWKVCSVRSRYNYIPCIDIEGATGKQQSYRHRERSCPRTPPICLVSLPEGYRSPVRWPESKLKVLYKNVAHPKLAALIKTQSWLSLSGEYLTFPQNHTKFKDGALHYIDSIEEMAPDIEWGKNIRLVLDIGCTDSSFVSALLNKEVLTLSFGLKDDLADQAQVVLERGFPALIGTIATRRLPFPGGVFDAIHCGECRIHWHSDGGKLLLEINRILRPGGYFILSTEQANNEVEEAMSKLTASVCWNILADRTDETNEVGVKIYQKPASNDIYELRRKKNPPMCKEDENPDAAWYAPMGTCLHKVPAAIEERGTEWPEEWPQRLESFPDWLSNRENLVQDTEQWKAIVNKSYLSGLGVDWSSVRNIMDMKAIYGGFAAALAQQKVWVMNVVPVHAPNTLPIIYERGLLGVYHDWCESFSTYPRSYDLLHADHLFSRLKNRCKQPLGIIVEMDRILRPGGWVVIRDKVEILDPLEVILRTLHWEIQMTYNKDKEGIICAKRTAWRP